MSIVIVRPIASPAIDLNVPRGSAAVAKTTKTRKNVMTTSIAKPAPLPITLATPGAPSLARSVSWSGKIALTASAPATAAANCVTQ